MALDGLPVPEGLRQLHDDVQRDLVGEPDIARLFGSAFLYTWQSVMRKLPSGEVFVSTGDIPAMWLRDSSAQVRPYLLAAHDPVVAEVLAGVLRNQVRYVLTDPYANAFNAEPNGANNGNHDLPQRGPLVWERKYEVDSLAAVLLLAHGLWRATGQISHLDKQFHDASQAIVDLWTREQDHEHRSSYTFQRIGGAYSSDTLPRGGRGGPVGLTGMTWSGFRPSDDRCNYGYLIPSNAMAAVALSGLAVLAGIAGWPDLRAQANALSAAITKGVKDFGVIGTDAGYAYEVDGLGAHTVMDDANSPSLLALPYLGWCAPTDPLYLRNRGHILSDANPYFYRGKAASGVGSPHTPPGYVWPLALAMQGLTSVEPHDQLAMAQLIARTDAGTGAVHESFDANDPRRYTRSEFGWGNALFSELAMVLTGRQTARLFPVLEQVV